MKSKHWYAIYGTTEPRLILITNKLGNVLDCNFHERYSSYIGDYSKATIQLSSDSEASEIKVRKNNDPEFGGLEEPNYPQCLTLIYASRIADIEAFEKKIESINLHKISLCQI